MFGCPPKKKALGFLGWVSHSFSPQHHQSVVEFWSQLRLGHLPRLDSIEEPTKSMCMELMNIQATALGGNRDGEMREM